MEATTFRKVTKDLGTGTESERVKIRLMVAVEAVEYDPEGALRCAVCAALCVWVCVWVCGWVRGLWVGDEGGAWDAWGGRVSCGVPPRLPPVSGVW